MQRFIGELRRRRVLNTAWFYVIGGWLVLQVAEVLQDMLPPATMRWLLVALAGGYPLALIVGWFFDISAEGIRPCHRTRVFPRAVSSTRSTYSASWRSSPSWLTCYCCHGRPMKSLARLPSSDGQSPSSTSRTWTSP